MIPAAFTWFAYAVPARLAFAGHGAAGQVWPVHHAVAGRVGRQFAGLVF